MSVMVFRKEVVFIVDISASMLGVPLENSKNALLDALSNLNPVDYFNIIAFNGDTLSYSSSMELATEEAIEKATRWITISLIPSGNTNILLPLNQAMDMVGKAGDLIPLIFLITDGTVEDEREICNFVKGRLNNGGLSCPRICTFGIGSYCNHYFLQMLAQIGRGYYAATYDVESINSRMGRLFRNASSVILANITIGAFKHLDSLELYPSHLPDLSSESPLILSGRFHGTFPDSFIASGTLADLENFVVDIKVQKLKDMPLDRIFARRQIDMLTSHAWFTESKQLEEKVSKMSIQTGFPSEYTRMILVQTCKGKQAPESVLVKKKMADMIGQRIISLRTLGVGFGSLTATVENLPPGAEEEKSPQSAPLVVKAASDCCSRLLDCCCCMCFIKACSRLNDQCAVAFTQLCAALACFECLNCCCELCVEYC
ncbi:hypothetical protein RJ639_045290 [Escallonia herrerae]|uniref:VWFA domain-containing protein n=1 Tax=Escallonia herrerae TaxID=1293975 RepID=A0AA88W6S2_9ASTE|nr:hypothetical protein RJ639_045290 [Escallonia herrerae]